MVRTVIEDLGMVAVAAGVALFNPAAGLIVAGLLLIATANLHAGRGRPEAPDSLCGNPEPHDRHIIGDLPGLVSAGSGDHLQRLCPGVSSP